MNCAARNILTGISHLIKQFYDLSSRILSIYCFVNTQAEAELLIISIIHARECAAFLLSPC